MNGFKQLIEQLNSYNFSLMSALRSLAIENYAKITKNLRLEIEFYDKNQNIF